jgi:hypothetical protein
MDVAAVEPGRDFRKAIDQSVATCSVLLAIIGQEWLELKDATGRRRLDNPDDFVRIELASALRRDIPVIPILVRGAKMPLPERLPIDLKELAYRNAVELSHARWKTDIQLLIQALRPYMDAPAGGVSAASKGRAETDRPRTVERAPLPAAGSATIRTPPAMQMFGAQTIDRISKDLATYIGPIADVIVKQAAKRCSSLEDLCTKVAREIEGEADRARFLRSCRSQ